MREKPILFSAPMVRAILEGRKTMTRRVVKPQFTKLWGQGVRHGEDTYSVHVDIPTHDGWQWLRCPYGKVGDRLWVRETHARVWYNAADGWQTIYRADTGNDGPMDGSADGESQHWKPSIFMSRNLSRITLEVTSVRVERVQEISMYDAMDEGVETTPALFEKGSHLVGAFAHLWDSINGKRGFGWESNPWVWVVTFKQVQP